MTAFLTAIVLKGSILMIAAAALVALMFRTSAATRHFVWTLVVAGLLLLPVLSTALPAWRVVVPMARSETISASIPVRAMSAAGVASAAMRASDGDRLTDNAPRRAPGDVIPWAALPAAYVLGVLILLGRLAVQRASARRIVREAAIVSDREWIHLLNDCAARIGMSRPVALRRSRVQVMPMTTGTIAPSIVIPADADTWDEDRRRAVLLHELAHIARQDCLTQLIAAVASALYWCHPGVWYVARRLRIEREVACDDRVLAAGAGAREYAGHLLEIAYTWSGRRAPALAVGMASSRKLEERLRAVLDPARNRATPTRRVWLAGTAIGALVLLPLAAVTMTAVAADVRSELMSASAERNTQSDVQIVHTQSQDRSAASQNTVTGTWEVRRSSRSDRVRLTVSGGGVSMNADIDERELEALTSQSLSNANGPIRFSVRRAAGVFEIEGTVRAGTGSGTFTFVPNQAFIAGLVSRQFPRPTALQLFSLAQADIGLEFVDVLSEQKYARPGLDDLVRAAHHGVDAEYVKEMANTGYRVGTLDALIRFRDHGVDPEFVRGLRANGVSDLSPDDLVRFRDHGVDPDYLSGMRQAGYRETLDLVRARDHGGDPEYVAVLRGLGYSSMDLEDVIRARDHGLDADYLHGMRDAGYKLPLADLIRARDHGVTPDYIVALAVHGYKELPIETLIRMRDHGVSPEFVLYVQKLQNKKPDPEELIRMRDRGQASYEQEITNALARLRAQFERLLSQYVDAQKAAADAR